MPSMTRFRQNLSTKIQWKKNILKAFRQWLVLATPTIVLVPSCLASWTSLELRQFWRGGPLHDSFRITLAEAWTPKRTRAVARKKDRKRKIAHEAQPRHLATRRTGNTSLVGPYTTVFGSPLPKPGSWRGHKSSCNYRLYPPVPIRIERGTLESLLNVGEIIPAPTRESRLLKMQTHGYLW